MKYPRLSPLKLFATARAQPALAEIGGNMMFASGSDEGGYGSSRGDGGRPDESLGSGSRNPRGAATGGRQRTVQFQPEERYWTEYLRIALPIIGLLLMIGLFWFWAQELINDPANPDQPSATTTPPGLAEIIGNDSSTPEPTTESLVATEPPQDPPEESAPPTDEAAAPSDGSDQPTEEAATEATEAPEKPAGELVIDGAAVINDSGVNLRPDASTAGEPVAVLDVDTTVVVADGPVEAEEYVWWQIVVDGTGETGWVAEDFLDPAP